MAKTTRAYEMDESTGTYQKTYPITSVGAIFTDDTELKTLGTKLTEIDTEVSQIDDKLGDLL